ncbi:MAG: InlB B-repeat-containing protein [Clostridia bacterium]|nr:InlB B-repeat-containing protein [Clostridia bacterium]
MKKFFSYLLTFAVLFVMAATGTIFLSITDGDNGSVPVNVDVEGAQEASFFSGLLATFEENKQFNVSGDVLVEYQETQIPLYIYANIDIADEKNIKVDGFLTIELKEGKVSVAFSFYNEIIYVSFKDFNLKVALSDIENLKDSVSEIFGMLDLNLEDMPLALPAFNIDMSSLMMSLNNVVSETLRNGDVKNTITIDNLAVADIIVSADNKIKSVKLSTEEIMGIKISAELGVRFSDNILISNPENNDMRSYIDIVNLLDFAKNLINLNKFDLSFTLDVQSSLLSGYISSTLRADVENHEVEWHVYDTSLNQFEKANVVFKEGNLYLNVDDVYVCISKDALSRTPELVKLIYQNYFKDFSLQNVLSNYKFDLSIVFDILNNIEKARFDESGCFIKYGENVIEIKIQDNMLSEVNLSVSAFDSKINLNAYIDKTQKSVEIEDAEKYLNVYSLYENGKEFIAPLKFDLSMNSNVKIAGKTYKVSADALFDVNNKYLHLTGLTTLNKKYNFDIIYKDDIAFVNINNTFIKCDKSRLFDLLNMYDIDIEKQSEETIDDFITESVEKYSNYSLDDFISKLDSLRKIEISADKIVISLDLSKFDIDARGVATISIENNMISVVKIEDFDFAGKYFGDIEIKVNSNEFEEENFDDTKYFDIFAVYDDVFNIAKLDEATYYTDVKVNYQEKAIGTYFKFAYNNTNKYVDLNGRLTIDNERRNFDIRYYDDELFVNVDDIYVKVNRTDIEKIAALLKGYFDFGQIDTDELAQNLSQLHIIEKFRAFADNLSINSLNAVRNVVINNNCVKITVNGDVVGLEKDVFLIINLNNNAVKDVEIINLQLTEDINISFKIALYRNKVKTEKVEEEKYLDIFGMIDDLFALKDLREASITLDADVEYAGNEYGANIAGSFNLDTNYYNLAGLVNYKGNNIDLALSYYNDEAYIKFNDIFVKANKENIDKIIALISQNVTIDPIDKTEILEKVFSLKLFRTIEAVIENFKYEDIENLKQLAINSQEFVMVVDKSILDTEKDFELRIQFTNGKLAGLEINNLELDDEIKGSVKVTLDRSPVETISVDENKYLDVFGMIDDLFALKDLREASITLDADVEYAGNEYGASLEGAFNLDTNYYNIVGFVNYKGNNIDLALSYYNDEAYIKFQDIFVKVSKENIEKIIAMLSQNISIDSVDTDAIVESVLSMRLITTIQSIFENISEEDIKLIKDIQIDSSKILLILDKTMLNTADDLYISISFNNSNISAIEINNLELDDDIKGSVKVTLDRSPVETISVDENRYLDIFGMIDDLFALKDLRQASVTLDADVEYAGNEYGASLEGAFNLDTNYYNLAGLVNYKGNNIDLALSYYNDEAYIKFKDIFVKVSKENIEKIIALISSNVSFESVDVEELLDNLMSMKLVDTIKDLIANFTESDINAIKLMKIDSSEIKLIVDKVYVDTCEDLIITISLDSSNICGIEIHNLELDDDIKGSVKVTLDRSPVDTVSVDEGKYLDVFELIENILGLENADVINATVDFALYDLVSGNYQSDLGFVGTINKNKTEDNLMALADFVLRYKENNFNLKGKLENSNIFADLNGFKIRIDSDKVLYTLHKILGLADMDTDEYDDLITRILNVLGGEAISKAFEGYDFGDGFDDKVEEIKNDIDIDIDLTLSQILENVKIDSDKIMLSVDLACIGLDIRLDVVIHISDSYLTYIQVDKLKLGEKYIDLKMTLDQTAAMIDALSEEEKLPYLDIKSLADLAEITYETIKNGSVSGVVEFDFKFNGNVNHIIANYGVKIADKKLTAFFTTTFNGLNINIYYVDGVFYVDLGGVSNDADNRLQIKATFEEHEALFDWVQETFGIDILEEIRNLLGMEEKLDLNNIRSVIRGETSLDFNLDEILNILANFDLDIIEKAVFTDGQLKASLKLGLDIGAYYDDIVNRVTIGYNKETDNKYQYFADITIVDFDDIVLDNIDAGKYVSYTVITDTISAIMNTLNSDDLAFIANAKFYENNKLSEQYLDVGYQDDKFYADYYGMKLSISRNSLSQVLSMALEILGMDPNLASIIGEVADTSDINTDNLQAAIPAIDLGNPFTMLNYLKSITLKNGVFTIVIDSELFGSSTGKDVEFKITTANNKLSKLEVNNIYTSAENNNFINVAIRFEKGISNSAASSYIDLSNSVDLIKAFLNTSQLNDYFIEGKVMLSVSSIDAAKIDVDAKIKLDENKKPTVVVTLSNYPMIVLVNDVNTNERGGTLLNKRYREMTIYYKDGELYLKTYDDSYRYLLVTYDSYERITRVTPGYLIDNIKYYLNWLLGFTSSIQEKIDEAIDVSMNYNGNDDYSNIILSYSKSGNSHYIKLNLQKIAHNDDIGELSITLTTTNNASTGYKDYLYAMDIDMKMLDNLLSLKTDSSNKLYLKNIGQTVNISAANSFINSYAYNPYGEYAKEGSGSFSQTNKKTITITLNKDGGTGVSSLSGNLGANMTLPTPTKIVDNGVTRTTYNFLGWFDADGNKCTLTYFPANNMTLTAHWEVATVQYYKTLTVINNNGSADQTYKQLQYTSVNLPALSDYVIDDGITRKTYTFLGWSLGGVNVGKNITVNLDDNKTIEGLWQEDVVYYRTAIFDSNGGTPVSSNKQLEGTVITLPNITKSTYDDGILRIEYTFLGWSGDDQVLAGGTAYTLASDVQFTAVFDEFVREYHTIHIVNEMLGINQTIKELNDHETYVLPTHETKLVEEANVRYYFDFVGYKDQNNNIISEYDFNRDVVATADYEEDVSRRVYISTLTVYNYDNSVILCETKINGQTVELPVLPAVVETEEIVDGRAYQVIRNFISYSESLTQMPSHDVDIYAIYEEVSRKAYYTLDIYDINTSTGQITNSLVSTRLFAGDVISYPTLAATEYNLTIGGEAGRFVFNGWDTTISTMPTSDVVIRATYLTYYTLTFYDINSSNGQITRQLSSTQVLVGSSISYPTISTTSYRINNSDGSYKIYTYTGWNNSATTMPNKNLTISASYSVTTYYKVQFDVSWYKPSWWLTNGTIKTSPTAPATQYVAAGTEMNLSSYSATIKVRYGINYTYSTKGWSTSKASNSSTALKKVTVNSNLTLYAVWDH